MVNSGRENAPEISPASEGQVRGFPDRKRAGAKWDDRDGSSFALQPAALHGVAHEVGTGMQAKLL
jgi:hypothetical protein